MITEAIHHAYNDVVAPHYDLDPQGVTGRSLDRAVEQLRQHHFFGDGTQTSRVLDLGMGTGLFLSKLKFLGGDQIIPFGLDLAENMIANARAKIADLVAEIDDAANLHAHFPGQTFDCVATHFMTGFVPMSDLAPKIWNRLEMGGYWSLVGGTKQAYPGLQSKARSWVVRWLCGAGAQSINDRLCNPANPAEVLRTFEAHGFEVCAAEVFEPSLEFRDFDQFMEFAYTGGWLTPVIHATGLHKAGALTRWILNHSCFPMQDRHNIAIVLARKVGNPGCSVTS